MHPKTGKVCVPFDPEEVDDFNPNECPTLTQCLHEYDEICKEEGTGAGKVVPCLQKSLKVFNKFLKGLKDEYIQITAKEKRSKQKDVNEMEVGAAF